MEEHKLNELQLKLLENMQWLHTFCYQNNLRYYLLGGSMLGAARHRGFIPWDDDFDIGMPREDYKRFADIMNNQIVDGYYLETPENGGREFYYSFSKLYDTSTTLVENYRTKVKRGIYIDIFPLDGMGNDEQSAHKYYSKIAFYLNLLLSRVAGIRKGRSIYKTFAILFVRCIPSAFLNEKKLQMKIERLCSSRGFDQYAWGGNPSGAWRFKEIMPREVMGIPTLYHFEDHEFFGVQNYDAYLTRLYGNWRELPPYEKRKSHHDYLECNLNKSYLE